MNIHRHYPRWRWAAACGVAAILGMGALAEEENPRQFQKVAAETGGATVSEKVNMEVMPAAPDAPGAATVLSVPAEGGGLRPPPVISPHRSEGRGPLVTPGADGATEPNPAVLSTGSNPETVQEMQALVGEGLAPAQVQAALKQGAGSPEFRNALQSLKTAGTALLSADRTRLVPFRTTGVTRPTRVSDLGRQPPQRMETAPMPGPRTMSGPECPRTRRIEDLEQTIAAEPDPAIREQKQLVLGANHVGLGNWGEAEAVYQELAASSANEGVQEAVRRNLRVVNAMVAVIGESDPALREQRELDFANVHQDLGHEVTARRLYRRLAQSATHPEVRAEAARLLGAPPEPGDPIALPAQEGGAE